MAKKRQYKEIAPLAIGTYNGTPLFCVGKHHCGQYMCKVGRHPDPVFLGSLVKFSCNGGGVELEPGILDKVEEMLNG